ncbi:carbohydrate ABC transporter permease [Candidatus Aerophobetes bacterium]|nr:carbohydrate ABC transporter permease [Candidatus Aerophobetes bacterium]
MIGRIKAVSYRKKIRKIFFWLGIVIVLLWCLFPYYWMFTTAFKVEEDYFAYPPVWFPSPPSLKNFRVIFLKQVTSIVGIGGIAVDIIPPLMNSIAIAVGSAVISVLMGALAGFALSRFKFRGRENIAFWIFTMRMLPPIAIIIPYFVIMKSYRLIDTHLGLIITYLIFNLPLAVWLLMRYFEDIPIEIEDAALTDGCSKLQAFRLVLLPLARPGIIATFLFCLIFSWNEYLFALILTRAQSETLPILLASFVAHKGVAWGPLAASGLIATFPILLCVVVFQKHLVRVMTMGMLKG